MREDDCLDAVAEVQLLQDVGDVGLDGGVADVELLGDLRVGEAARDLSQHVELAIGQLFELFRRRRVREVRELFDHALRDRGREKRLAAGDDAERGEELLGRVSIAAPENRDFATLVESDAGKAFLSGAWRWYSLLLVNFLFNTMLGEELFCRA